MCLRQCAPRATCVPLNARLGACVFRGALVYALSGVRWHKRAIRHTHCMRCTHCVQRSRIALRRARPLAHLALAPVRACYECFMHSASRAKFICNDLEDLLQPLKTRFPITERFDRTVIIPEAIKGSLNIDAQT